MKKLLYLSAIILLFSCEQTLRKQHQDELLKESKYKSLLSKYKDISFDTLKVFSVEDPGNNKYKFKGVQLDSSDASLLQKSFSKQFIYDNGLYACFKFDIDSVSTALITRTPSIYESTSIKLTIFDKQKDSIIENIELSEIFADAGDYADKISWLFKDEKRKYKIFMWHNVRHDNSVDSEKDTAILTWNYYYLFNIAKLSIDTVSKNGRELTKQFGNLLKSEASR